jgi:hypothetical protein
MPRGVYARKKPKDESAEVRVPLDAVPERPSKYESRKPAKPAKKGANLAVIAELLVEVAKHL